MDWQYKKNTDKYQIYFFHNPQKLGIDIVLHEYGYNNNYETNLKVTGHLTKRRGTDDLEKLIKVNKIVLNRETFYNLINGKSNFNKILLEFDELKLTKTKYGKGSEYSIIKSLKKKLKRENGRWIRKEWEYQYYDKNKIRVIDLKSYNKLKENKQKKIEDNLEYFEKVQEILYK